MFAKYAGSNLKDGVVELGSSPSNSLIEEQLQQKMSSMSPENLQLQISLMQQQIVLLSQQQQMLT